MAYRAMGPNSWQRSVLSPVVRRRKPKLQLVLLALLVGIASGTYMLLRISSNARPPLLMPRDCDIGPTEVGIDVSHYQGEIVWAHVKRAGIAFAFIRVYDGTDTFDTQFYNNWFRARRAHVPRGAYQYFRPEQSPIDQADALIKVLRANGTGELPPVLDVEVTGGLPLQSVAERAKIWVDRVRTQLGVEPIVYTNPGMWRLRPATEISSQPLWLAHYTTTCPELVQPWKQWTYWQYTDNGHIDGITGPVDLDLRRAR
jgi:lysozyme